MPKYKIGEKLLAFPYDEYLGYYQGDDYGNPIPVEIISIIPHELKLYGVLLPNKFPHVFQEKELFRTQEEIMQAIRKQTSNS